MFAIANWNRTILVVHEIFSSRRMHETCNQIELFSSFTHSQSIFFFSLARVRVSCSPSSLNVWISIRFGMHLGSLPIWLQREYKRRRVHSNRCYSNCMTAHDRIVTVFTATQASTIETTTLTTITTVASMKNKNSRDFSTALLRIQSFVPLLSNFTSSIFRRFGHKRDVVHLLGQIQLIVCRLWIHLVTAIPKFETHNQVQSEKIIV